jgi:hypothetical protein
MTTLFANTNVSTVDRLGEIKAQIADLQAIEKQLVEAIKEQGVGNHQGEWFAASVIQIDERFSLDAKAAEAKLRELGVDGRWFAKNQKRTSGYTTVRVNARKTSN